MNTIERGRPLLLLKKIRASTGPAEDKIPPNHFSVVQWASKWGISRDQTAILLKRAVAAKLMIVVVLRRRNATGGICKIPHYAEV